MSLLTILRSLVVALVVLGLSAGSMAYAQPASMAQMVGVAGQGQVSGMPCDPMSAVRGADVTPTKNKIPCNTITPDCGKAMVCLQVVALPEHSDLNVGPVTFATVSYRVSASLHSGLTLEPELSPPLAA